MKNPLVGIIMGSSSDLPIMKQSAEILNEFGIKTETKILSAHRTPDEALDYAKNAQKNGLKIIIAGAGGAAHLAGVMASSTILPVIAVPIKSANSLNGLDSLLSMVQMPSGVPVATVAIDGAKNAGILAAQILALSDDALGKKLAEFKVDLAKKVKKQNDELKTWYNASNLFSRNIRLI